MDITVNDKLEQNLNQIHSRILEDRLKEDVTLKIHDWVTTNVILKASNLTKEEYLVIKLRYSYEMFDDAFNVLPCQTFSQIATRLDKNIDEVKSIHNKALLHLRQVAFDLDLVWRCQEITSDDLEEVQESLLVEYKF